MRTLLFAAALFALAAGPAAAQEAASDVQVGVPAVALTGTPFSVTVRGEALDAAAGVQVRVGEQTFDAAPQEDGTFVAEGVQVSDYGANTVEVLRGGAVVQTAATRGLPGWLSIVPPLLAIAIALAFKRVIPALFLGVWMGAWIAEGFSVGGLFFGLLDTFQVYVLSEMADTDHAAIILFSLMIGGMVGIISKNGGTRGVVNRIIGWSRTARRGQVATAVLGLAIFFDDYANTLIVGNTMRPVTDRLRISREKLAYIVDSTAAPVASLALVTTWIGFEVSLIDEATSSLPGLNMAGYTIFLESILYRFYPILALVFVFAIALTDREFGPMWAAEQRARSTGAVLGEGAKVDEAAIKGEELSPLDGEPQRAFNAVIPVLVLVGGVVAALYYTGGQVAGFGAPLREVIGEADSYKALMWGSLLGVLTAAVLSVGQRILSLDQTIDAWYAGLKSMLFAMIVLLLAWALSAITDVLHTADFLGAALSEALPAGAVPALVFVLSAATAFATGSSWGAMGILMPLVVPLTWAVLQANQMADPAHYHILYSSVSCVLAGSVWGDHCSPISDTTILSSMASGCDHIEHVRTQLPYALSVGLVAILLGTLPAGFGMPWWLGLALGAAVLFAVLRFFGEPLDGRRAPEPVEKEQPAAAPEA